MYAKSNIKAGDLILREEPFNYVLKSNFRTLYCDHCFVKGELLKCSNCQYVYYCGKACQRNGWSVHKTECKNLKKIAPRLIPDAARFMARLIHKLNKGGHGIRSYYSEDKFRMFKDLMSHYSDLKFDQTRLEHFTSLCAVLFEFLGDTLLPNSAELIGMYGRMCINSFSICDAELKSIGTGMYLGASIIDHSCAPNAIATFEGPTLFLRTLVDLKIMDWTKVFISYIDVLNTPEGRREELEKQYYFLCKCAKCLSDTRLCMVYGAVCLGDGCHGCVDMRDTNDLEELRCSECSKTPDVAFVERFKQVMELSKENINNMKSISYLDVCRFCLKQQEGLLHKLNYHHVKILEMAFESCIDMNYWEEAMRYGVELIDGYLFYYNESNPLVGLLYMKLAKISSLLEKRKQAIDFLKNAFRILKITHGVHSTIFKTEIRPLMQQLTLEI